MTLEQINKAELARLKKIVDSYYCFYEGVVVKQPEIVKADLKTMGKAFVDNRGNSIYPIEIS